MLIRVRRSDHEADEEAREALEFSAALRLPATVTAAEREELVSNNSRLNLEIAKLNADETNAAKHKADLEELIEQLHQEKLQGNLASALESLDYNQDGKFEFHEFKQMHKQFPQVLYPAFRLQQIMMDNICGSTWWNKKKGRLAMEKEEAIRKDREERIAQARKLEVARQKQIKKHMGALKYYLMPHKRAKYDELYPPAKPGRR